MTLSGVSLSLTHLSECPYTTFSAVGFLLEQLKLIDY